MRCIKCKAEFTAAEQQQTPGACPRCGIVYQKLAEFLFSQLQKMQMQLKEAKAQASLVQPATHTPVMQAAAAPVQQAPKRTPAPPTQYPKSFRYCTTCQSIDKPKRHVPGSIVIEIILWLMFLIPGLIYSVWRMASAKKSCSACGSLAVVPLTSPIALKALYR